jgi:amino acid adenylation domain-containing protein
MVAIFDRCVAHVCSQITASSSGDSDQIDEVQLIERESLHATQRAGFAPAPIEPGINSILAKFQLFVANQPDSPAITFEGNTLSYAELDRLSTAFGSGLCAYGVQAGDRVGVCLERSLELVPVLAGILKCGATYVPIEPSAPYERQRFIVRNAGLRVLVTSRDDFAADPGVAIVSPWRLSEASAQTGHCYGHDDSAVPAYIIYTSGSTGRPKGVLISQQSVLSLIKGLTSDLALSHDDRWTFFHSAAFDFATWEIWGCLLTGGHLFVVPYFVSRSPDEFLQLLSEHRITVLNQTPTAFLQLQAADQARRSDLAVRLVIFGGETLDARSLLPWMNRRPGSTCRLVNMYGITETTVHVTAELVTRQHALRGARTVGPPIRGWSVYIKDEAGRHLPSGLAGEIYVGGSGLAVGYWNNDEENRSRFAVDSLTGERLYRSGDRGRLRPDGRLDHLGRLDNQVKLRGFRIELDEIRAVMMELDGVKVAQVVLREPTAGRPGEASIEAFVVGSGRRGSDIRAELRGRLPDYMLPSRISVLDRLPLTTNGKFDIGAALLAADSLAFDETTPAQGDKTSTVTSTEKFGLTIAALWSETFGQNISPSDNFFDLGGNSLMAVRLANSMRKLNCPVASVRNIYIHQTPDQLARVWREQATAEAAAPPRV